MTELQFREWKTPAGFATSAVIPEKLSCGIYELSFANGELYVGKTINFPARLSSHRRRWDDIEAVRFAEVPRENLDEYERATIQNRRDQKRRLRNILLQSQPEGPSPLDYSVDPQVQAAWLQLNGEQEPQGVDPERIMLAKRRIKSRSKFNTLREHPEYSKVLDSIATYISKVIVWPQETEGRQWSLTALPSTARSRSNRRLVTLSIHNVEMLVIGESVGRDNVWAPYSFLNTAVLRKAPIGLQVSLYLNHNYRSAGAVHTIEGSGADLAPKLLEMPHILLAARQLAMGQLRKGSSVLARHHNDSFADEVFAAMDL